MKTKITSLLVVALVCAATIVIPAASAAAATAEAQSVWLTATRNNSDGTSVKMTYHATVDGQLIEAPFPTPNTAISSIAVDPTNRTLWGTNEGSSTAQNPGKLVNYDRSGSRIQEILSSEFGAVGGEGTALTLSPDNDTLWVVDDPLGVGLVPTVYNISRNGDLISKFPTSRFDPATQSPQSIAYDPFTSSLWIADNSTETVYNVSLNGSLISSFRTNSDVFKTSEFPSGVRNVQGISVESASVLWITARDTSRVYRVSTSGDQILSSFDIETVEAGASDPTGVAFERPPGDLGAAASFGVLGLVGAELKMKDVDRFTGVVGDVGLGPNAEQNWDQGLVAGSYLVDPNADDSHGNSVVVSGGTVATDLGLAVSDAEYASLAASVLVPSQAFGEIKASSTIAGVSGLNVIAATKIELDEETLTLVGDASSTFIINLADKLKLKNGSSIVLQGGLSPAKVFFNVLGTSESVIESGSFAVGTIIAPTANLKIKGEGSGLVGAMIGGREIKLEDGGRLRVRSSVLAPGDIGEAAGAAVLGLPGSKVKLSDSGSTIVGEVVLGPFAEQDFSEGLIDGVLALDPAADDSHDNDVVITGGTVTAAASLAVADAVDASYAMARLSADQQFDEIKDDATIGGGPGLNVVAVEKIELDGNERLTLVGNASTVLVINVSDRFTLKDGSAVVLSGGLLPDNVVFNVLGSHDATIEDGSAASGTILALRGKLKVKDAGSSLLGTLISGGDIIVEKGGSVTAS
jgi:uncharacterized protein YjiK